MHTDDAEASCRRTCVVADCCADLSGLSKYCQQRRVCDVHRVADCVKRRDSDGLWRFCQQCGKLEPLTAFDDNRRSCRKQLARRRAAAAKSTRTSSLATLDQLAAAQAAAAGPCGTQPVPMQVEVPASGVAPAAGGAVVTATRSPGSGSLAQELQACQQQCAVLKAQIMLLEQQAALEARCLSPQQQQELAWSTTAVTEPCSEPLAPLACRPQVHGGVPSQPPLGWTQLNALLTAADPLAATAPRQLLPVAPCHPAASSAAVRAAAPLRSFSSISSSFTTDRTAAGLGMDHATYGLLQRDNSNISCSGPLGRLPSITQAAAALHQGQIAEPAVHPASAWPQQQLPLGAQGLMMPRAEMPLVDALHPSSSMDVCSTMSEPLAAWGSLKPPSSQAALPQSIGTWQQQQQQQPQPPHQVRLQQAPLALPVVTTALLPPMGTALSEGAWQWPRLPGSHAATMQPPGIAEAVMSMPAARGVAMPAAEVSPDLAGLSSGSQLGVEVMECDSVETIADILEMALLEAGMEASRSPSVTESDSPAPVLFFM